MKMRSVQNWKTEPIAIVGSSCRFPGQASSPSKLWEILRDPVDLLSEIPPSRFNPAGFYHENTEHHRGTNVKHAYLLHDDPRHFDHELFKIHAKEAESMDPQQRILLETVYESIESAGYSIPHLKGSSTGVFVGQMSDDYRDILFRDVDSHPRYIATGTSRAIVANRISYVFDWRGPSVNIDTACSSSLVALHQGVQALRNGDCETAVIAGVNLILGPELFVFESSLRMLSPDGRSRMWDSAANGYARGEGFAAIVIKTLKQALSDNDHIECIIRETGVNQDGHSSGLTVPSADAQTALIESTYAKCGLNSHAEEHHPQYFEAHGTGTPVGDPKEAQAIHNAFFGDDAIRENRTSSAPTTDKLFVGSIKSVIGHLEGAAGLAGVLKASLALQHGFIPPNMLFEELNPEIQPFYQHLEVPTALQPWPEPPLNSPRRASVNSFGFGGTNAHAILESWESPCDVRADCDKPGCYGPFVLSANSKKSLQCSMTAIAEALASQNNVDLSRLSWTLQCGRTPMAFRTFFSAGTQMQLIGKLQSALLDSPTVIKATQVPEGRTKRLLGVFTGQGAQWPAMGAALYHQSAKFRATIHQLERNLRDIHDGPTWSLSEELLASDASSRVHSAKISQPLCSALQIALVDLLRECGVYFSAVVGHSSGEIAAAYAAGLVGPEEAMAIAFYRGHHSHLAQSPNGTPGKMMAVTMTFGDAEEFCRRPEFLGKITPAASNSSSSVTLSGDADSIDQASKILADSGTFARVLKVDKAYHSHHMLPVRDSYLASLSQYRAGIRRSACMSSPLACNLYSSVYSGRLLSNNEVLSETYWGDNLVRPVLFSQALTAAVQGEELDLALEVGPHPALQVPATETIGSVGTKHLPYHGVLKRKEDDVGFFSDALGFIWAHLDSPAPAVDFASFRRVSSPNGWIPPQVMKDLPTYQWDHERPLLRESRKSKAWRTCSEPLQELLGTPTWSCNNTEVQWRNILKLSEVDWLQGHQFQGQVLFPSAGYMSMAVNAALHLVRTQEPLHMVELHELLIHNGITVEEDSELEMNFTIRLLRDEAEYKEAEYACYCSNVDASLPELCKKVFTGRATITTGTPTHDALPPRLPPTLPLSDVPIDRFYNSMRSVGLQYSGDFVLDSMKRRPNFSTVTATPIPTEMYRMHPGTLDALLQSLFAAFSYPGDGRLWTPYLPTSFRQVSINMATCSCAGPYQSPQLIADGHLEESSASGFCGDINVFCASGTHPQMQIQGVRLSSLEAPVKSNDINVFARTRWEADISSSLSDRAINGGVAGALTVEHARELSELCERSAYFFLRQLCSVISREEIQTLEWHAQCLMRWAIDQVVSTPRSSQITDSDSNWNSDTAEVIESLINERFAGQIDLELIRHLGPKLPSIVRGVTSALEVLMEDDRLKLLYQQGLGMPEANTSLGAAVAQIAHKYPRMRILEVGAGTGGATRSALSNLQSKCEEYVFTDVSPGFFEEAETIFDEFSSVMKYRVLDIERSPVEQGFQPHSFDLIIASNVLHATRSIEKTVRNCRELLRPGGYLVLLEFTSNILRLRLLCGGLPGWWLGHEEGRTLGPTITEAQWDSVLRGCQFSGVDHVARDFQDDSMHTYSVMVSQAIDDRVDFLREPLRLPAGQMCAYGPHISKLFLVSGSTLATSKTARKVTQVLDPFVKTITVVDGLSHIGKVHPQSGSAVVCLVDLSEPVFKKMTQETFLAVQTVFKTSKYLLWASRGRLANEPLANLVVGMGRSIARERPDLRLQFVDFDDDTRDAPEREAIILGEMLLRMVFLDTPGNEDVLWSRETELAMKDGVINIPRVIPDDILNDRFNATRRLITRNVSPITAPVSLAHRDKGVILESRIEHPCEPRCPHNASEIRMLACSLHRFSVLDSCPFYIGLGTFLTSSKKCVAISSHNVSMDKVAPDSLFELAIQDAGSAPDILEAIITLLICQSFLHGTTKVVWVHNATSNVFEYMSRMAKAKGVGLYFTSDDSKSEMVTTGKATYVHPRTAKRDLVRLIPNRVERFIELGDKSSREFMSAVHSCLGEKVDIRRGFASTRINDKVYLPYNMSEIQQILRGYASSSGLTELSVHDRSEDVVRPEAVHTLQVSSPATVLDWTCTQSVPVRIAPIHERTFFSAESTYFLVGLTGDVGLSLCEWMTDRGAKHFAICSRSPKVAPQILQHLEDKGAVIRVLSLDITDKKSLATIHNEIVSSMPPIAGVVNGALVLRDMPFDSMSFNDLEAVIGPRVTGSQNLDDLFHSTELDFFILLSSLSSVSGNPSQSNYNASNLFMSSLVAQRRKRGLAASVLDIGMLLGFGNLHKSPGVGAKVEAHFREEGFCALSESDFHIMFAEAIDSGRPDSGLDPEIITGLGNHIDTDWSDTPRLWHYRVRDQAPEITIESSKATGHRDLQSELREARDPDDALSLLEIAFKPKLASLLGCSPEKINRDSPLVSLGLDSLVAVVIRAWFLKILEVDVPIMKVLGGASVSDVCQDVLDKLPMSLKPWVTDSAFLTPSSCTSVSDEHARMVSEISSEIPSEDEKLSSLAVNSSGDTAKSSDGTHGTVHNQLPPEAFFERTGDLSHAQAQLYFLHEYLEDKSAYNVAYFGHFHGHLDVMRLKKALRNVAMRHESLRSTYSLNRSTGRPVQSVLSEPRIIFEHIATPGDGDIGLSIKKAIRHDELDIEHGVVVKVVVHSRSSSLHQISFVHHHIAIDGISWGLLLSDLAQEYSGSRLTHLPQQSLEMARKLALKASENMDSDLKFWRQIFQSCPDPLPVFPFAKTRTRQSLGKLKYLNDSTDTKLAPRTCTLVRKASQNLGITSFHFYLACVASYLSRCLHVTDVAIGVVDANRPDADDTIGYFLNMLPLRVQASPDDSFSTVARHARDRVLAALEHSLTPFDTVVDHLGFSKSNDPSHPLFQVALNYHKGLSIQTELGQSGYIEWTGGLPAGNPYDLLVNIHETPDTTFISFVTQSYLYDVEDAKLMLEWFVDQLETFAQEPETQIAKSPLTTNEGVNRAVQLGSGIGTEIPWTGTLIDRIIHMTNQHPDHIAIQDADGQLLTYAEVGARTRRIVRQLREVSIARESFVAMLLDPVADAICCILAIWWSGLVWVPLDTRNHNSRLLSIVSESKPQVLLCNDATSKQADRLAVSGVTKVINIDNNTGPAFPSEDDANQDNLSRPEQPAVILYTSGSTGSPKGVILTHEGLVNQIYGSILTLDLGTEITLQQSPLGFDLMLDQVFLALCNGGTVVMVGKEGRGDPLHIAKLIVSANVSLTHFVPSEYLALLNYGFHILQGQRSKSWRYAMSGGERLGPELRRAFRKLDSPELQLVNVYGPAEITIACARGIAPYRTEVDVLSEIDWLRTSPNYRVEVRDEAFNIMPVGYPGEICIAGPGVGLGYLNRPEESRRKFLDMGYGSSTRVYRSGDFGRILPNGTLKILGRLDGDVQVKIRGHRVELDEIANAIMQMSDGAIVSAAVSLRSNDVLVAFVVFAADFAGEKSRFADDLKSSLPLPLYMMPEFIIPTDQIPATSNGKIDRTAVDKLPVLDESAHGDSIQTVQNQVLTPWEKSLKDVWEEVVASRVAVLSHKRAIDSGSDFFQVGGNSLLLIKLRSVLSTTFGVETSLPELFQFSVLGDMARLLESRRRESSASAKLSGINTKEIDWDVEIATLADGLGSRPGDFSDLTAPKSPASGPGLIVLLTGATGFIGRHVLDHLVRDPRIKEVHCIAIRTSRSGEPRHVSIRSPKVIEYAGDLSDLSLGLSDAQMASLSSTVDFIIHNGAEVSLMKTYQSLRRPNVVSTRVLCEIAFPRRVPVHFVSTASVAKVVETSLLHEVSAAYLSPQMDKIDGYAVSKWASEVLLEKIAEDNGLPVWVHRLAHVVGDDASELDAVGMLFKYSLLLGKLPKMDPARIEGEWDFVQVDKVASDMVESAVQSVGAPGHGGPRESMGATHFVHHCDDVKVPHEEFLDYLQKEGQSTIKEVEMADWLTAALEAGLHPLVRDFLGGFVSGSKPLVLPMLAKGV